ncbi:MAG: HdaA/DnaA family protein [Gammaproteobacteria bacterium]
MNTATAGIHFPPPPPRLADFISAGNEEALRAVQSLAAGQSAENSLYLWGAPGSGKTHLLRAAAAAAREEYGMRVFMPKNGDVPPPVAAFLIVDDVQLLGEESQTALFDWHNRATQKGGSLLLAAGVVPPPQLPLRGELSARLSGGLVFRLRALGDGDKRQALAGFAGRHYFSLPPEVADLLLTRLPRDMAGLTAALADLDSFMLAEQKPLTIRRANAWLASYRPPPSLFAD